MLVWLAVLFCLDYNVLPSLFCLWEPVTYVNSFITNKQTFASQLVLLVFLSSVVTQRNWMFRRTSLKTWVIFRIAVFFSLPFPSSFGSYSLFTMMTIRGYGPLNTFFFSILKHISLICSCYTFRSSLPASSFVSSPFFFTTTTSLQMKPCVR